MVARPNGCAPLRLAAAPADAKEWDGKPDKLPLLEK